MTRKGAGMAASCRAYQSGSSVVARRRVRLSSSGSRRPRLLGTHRDVSSMVASTRTSTGWVQPWDRCPSLRRLLIDMIEECARHVGHADLIRESVDGLAGEDPE